jgi:hypothetical protein
VTEFRNHGTGWAETELVMDVVTLYDEWDGDSELILTNVTERLHTFHGPELLKFKVVLTMLDALIQRELAQRV